jgi:hypothetical protein
MPLILEDSCWEIAETCLTDGTRATAVRKLATSVPVSERPALD